MKNRTKSIYTVDVETDDPNGVLDDLRAACPVPYASSGVDARRAFIRFQAASDEAALEIATQINPPSGAVLHTGYGMHVRIVAEQP